MPTFIDQCQRRLSLSAPPQRIVSLCPSLTETLFALGVGQRVVGRTRFCLHPRQGVTSVLRVGGTKAIRYERVAALRPDLIIAEKEENTPEMVERLARDYPVYVADVRNLPTALAMIGDLGQLTGTEAAAEALTQQIAAGFAALPPGPVLRVAYLIWRDPWMGAGRDTYIHDVLTRLGWVNVLAPHPGRYPAFTLADLAAAGPALVLLSSEPFPFGPAHQAELAQALPDTAIRLVDGEMFSWYGSRMLQAIPYLRRFLSA